MPSLHPWSAFFLPSTQVMCDDNNTEDVLQNNSSGILYDKFNIHARDFDRLYHLSKQQNPDYPPHSGLLSGRDIQVCHVACTSKLNGAPSELARVCF